MVMVETRTKIDEFVCQFLRRVQWDALESLAFVWKILALCGLLCSSLDDELQKNSLDDRTSCKWTLASAVMPFYRKLTVMNLFYALSMLRPSWLRLMVSRMMMKRKNAPMISMQTLIDEENNNEDNESELTLMLRNMSLNALLSTFHYDLILSALTKGPDSEYAGVKELEQRVTINCDSIIRARMGFNDKEHLLEFCSTSTLVVGLLV
jgi:hypothetical protein